MSNNTQHPDEYHIEIVDFRNPEQYHTWLELLNSYAKDPMGGGTALATNVLTELPRKMQKRQDAVCFLARTQTQSLTDNGVGLLNAFEGFSTFAAQPLLNIHDVYVQPHYRGTGVVQALFCALEHEAKQRQCCKITLEVLTHNQRAKNAYQRLGFSHYQLDPTAGGAIFWQKILS